MSEQSLVRSIAAQGWHRADTITRLLAMTGRTQEVAIQPSEVGRDTESAESRGGEHHFNHDATKRSYRRVSLLCCAMLLVGVFWWNISPMLVSQQQVYSCLDETFAELKSLRSAKTDDESWGHFRQRSLTKLGALVPKLEQDADVSDPASLSLLGVARDYLPGLLKEKSRSSAELESKISRHLAVARSSMLQGSTSAVPAELWLLILGSLNIGLAIGALWIVSKKLFFKTSRDH